jgi:hypothetical protein
MVKVSRCLTLPHRLLMNVALDLKVLSRWLSPQDRVLATLNRDHSFFVDQQVEFTCLWFQKHLSRFLQSDKTFFLVTGQPGAGKTTLAGSIVERLQRPVNRKQVDTLFCSLSPDVPTTATSLAVVKSLLFQLLNIRVGNMGMYFALHRAYHQCRTSADLETYEGNLWSALDETLKHPTEGGNDLIIVVDGLDEIAQSQSASIQAAGAFNPSALLEKLVNITNAGRGVRLITLSSSIKMPSELIGFQHEITHDDIRDDLHSVALRALVNNKHFHGKTANEQEALLDRIIQAANGSFLWTILVCENRCYKDSHKSAVIKAFCPGPCTEALFLTRDDQKCPNYPFLAHGRGAPPDYGRNPYAFHYRHRAWYLV